MTSEIVSLALMWIAAICLVVHWGWVVRAHARRLDHLDLRVHVNGIRGKSTVTRLVAAVLREGGFVTVAKTTGSAARVIGALGEETPIRRWGAPTINEQMDIVRDHVTDETEALVIECMAVRPQYQDHSQRYMVRSDITVITNVRLDHQEEMGETLEQIADALALTIPTNGVLITAEDRPHLRELLTTRAAELGTRTVFADPAQVSERDMAGFDYLQFKANIAIGLTLAEIVGISREDAIRGMWKGVPDIGVVRTHSYDIRGKRVMWVPMFATNDRESVSTTMEELQATFPDDATVIAILNNRHDRGRRAEQFAEMAASDLARFVDHIVLFGAYEHSVAQAIVERGIPDDRVHRMGDASRPTLEEILDQIADLIPGELGVLVGMANIHTEQAEMLIEYFAAQSGLELDELELSRDPARHPLTQRRVHWQAARQDAE